MDDGCGPGVEEVKSPQDLSAPATDDLWLDDIEASHVPANIAMEKS